MLGDVFNTFPLARMAARLRELAARGVYVGTSSWKYPGWLGTVYQEQRYVVRKRFSQKKFQEECLNEFAETFHTVCVDAGYYAFPTEAGMAKLANAVPDGFRFAFKVTDDITLKHFPRLPRFGVRGGTENPHFLDAQLFADRFLAPCEPYRNKIGPLMFEFSTLHENDFARGRDFVEKLDTFLSRLPPGWRYGVEVRNANLLRPEYFQMLTRHRVAHVFNSWTRMPPVVQQLAMPGSTGTADFMAARFLLKPGRTFAEAVEKFAPYNKTGEVYEEARQGIRHIIDMDQTMGQVQRTVPRFLFINNRLEGNALRTILAAILGENVP
ncbi:MAG: DUF72 domain-containing protein [Candidatus Methylacidiphilales bacterium]|nr:DUF72 domain-containing protein [Candidatus Methylacidiphilales bacterium]